MILFNFCCLPIPVKLSRDLKKLPVFIQVSAWHFDHRKNIKLLIVISTMISNLRKICTCIPRNPAVSVRRNSVFYSKKKQVLHVLYSDLLDLDLNNERNERWLSSFEYKPDLQSAGSNPYLSFTKIMCPWCYNE